MTLVAPAQTTPDFAMDDHTDGYGLAEAVARAGVVHLELRAGEFRLTPHEVVVDCTRREIPWYSEGDAYHLDPDVTASQAFGLRRLSIDSSTGRDLVTFEVVRREG
jgi:hypothetical protein